MPDGGKVGAPLIGGPREMQGLLERSEREMLEVFSLDAQGFFFLSLCSHHNATVQYLRYFAEILGNPCIIIIFLS